MRPKTFLSILIGVSFIALLLWLGVYAYNNIVVGVAQPIPAPAQDQDQPVAMTAFLVAWPNFVVDGSHLDKVEIWGVPTGTDVAPSNYKLIGDATLQASSDPLTQIWTLPIPKEPVLATEIFAKAFDMKGEFVGQMSLPYLGATQVFNAIWANAPAVTSSVPDTQRHFSFGLTVGEQATVGGLTVKLIGIESDSRCPRSAVCIWAGEVEAKVELIAGGRDETVGLHSMSSPSVFANYQISITGVAPARSGPPPAPGDYHLTFSVEKM